ncbi:hypothetical protein GCM10009801_56530 [Streptomyces albiaxialis]|uniref:Uncharacterized protein n=1 Tax=Streptomyces albiaxialis TaxID=329523 RepID=A0ABN2WG70_9ACTN
MGLDLTLFMADWDRLRTFPVEDRVDALEDAVWPPGRDIELFEERAGKDGWLWPPDDGDGDGDGPAWCAEYSFHSTTGSYIWHARAGDGWDDMRAYAEPSLRAALDTFLAGLIWDAVPEEPGVLREYGGVFPAETDPGRARLLLFSPPEAQPERARAWERAAPRLDELREPFALECAEWGGRPDTFEEFTVLLGEWGDVVTESARRGWGLVGLP